MSTILITGGNSGIGLATAKRFAAKGWTVGIVGRRADAVAQAVVEVGAKAIGFTADVGKVSDIVRLAGEAKAKLGTLDALFVNAGLAEFRPLEASDEAYFDHVMNVNFKGAYFTVQQLVGLLANPGAIVLNTSITGEMGLGNVSVYSSSKAALRSLARTLSRELLPKGIRVNAVSPGPIETPIFGKMGMSAEQAQGLAAAIVGMVPMGRYGTSEEIAAAVEFLATEQSSYVAGFELVVDGGMSQL
jgi:NAD(P)-dependent dehydrogenase (short-subunit alcohol dehydrogenase family)